MDTCIRGDGRSAAIRVCTRIGVPLSVALHFGFSAQMCRHFWPVIYTAAEHSVAHYCYLVLLLGILVRSVVAAAFATSNFTETAARCATGT